jgi:hypothetical protein
MDKLPNAPEDLFFLKRSRPADPRPLSYSGQKKSAQRMPQGRQSRVDPSQVFI